MPDFEKLIKGIERILKLIFENQVPPGVLKAAGYILLIALILLGIWGALSILSKIKNLVEKEFLPFFYSDEEQRRRKRRRRFADHIEHEIRRLNNLEEWRDYRFTELEAEVEAEGQHRTLSLPLFVRRAHSGLRREASLSKALASSQERLVLLEGAPGAGKSVALRHLARNMSIQAMKARSKKCVIPLYINLKELERPPGKSVNSELIRCFVLKSLNRVNDRDIDVFLDEEFDRGIREGTWFFLFDSFDEIPEVLSSTEADNVIQEYAEAISDFLCGMNQCRGIVASRQFRGPGMLGWPRFLVMPLDNARRRELVHKIDIKSDLERVFLGEMEIATSEIRSMLSNPMFLGLLCEHVKSGHPFPENAHAVFESYIETRLARDRVRLERRFGLMTTEVRHAAESLSFCMAADPGLGLSPTRKDLESATKSLSLEMGDRFEVLLDALEYLKLARSETATIPGESKPFTFAHRRFQEYFATCVVLRDPRRVSPRELLTVGRWREAAVVMCQIQPLPVLAPLIEEAKEILFEMTESVSELLEDPIEYIIDEGLGNSNDKNTTRSLDPQPFPWPSGAVHVLGLLQDGFGSRLSEIPEVMRRSAGRLLVSAHLKGTISDRKWALAVAGIAPQPILRRLIEDAFASPSQWINETAYYQTVRLHELPGNIAAGIRRALFSLFNSKRLRSERFATRAHLARLENPHVFVSIFHLLRVILVVDALLHIAAGLLWIFSQGYDFEFLIRLVLILLFSYAYPLIYLGFARMGAFTAVVSLFTRATIILALLRITGGSPPLVSLLISELLILWAPFAILAAHTGQFVDYSWWPLMSIWPLLLWVRAVRKSISDPHFAVTKTLKARGAIQDLFSDPVMTRMVLLILMIMIAIYGPAILVPYLIARILNYEYTIVLMFYWGFLFTYFFGTGNFRSVKHKRKWLNQKRNLKASITGREFLNLIDEHDDRTFRNKLVEEVVQKHLLIVTEEVEDGLESMAVAIERALLGRAYPSFGEMISHFAAKFIPFTLRKKKICPSGVLSVDKETNPFDFWLTQHTDKELAALGSVFLDKICQILEQSRITTRR